MVTRMIGAVPAVDVHQDLRTAVRDLCKAFPDAATFAGSGLLLAVLAVLAGLVPAWRATRVDPLRALRTE